MFRVQYTDDYHCVWQLFDDYRILKHALRVAKILKRELKKINDNASVKVVDLITYQIYV